MGIEWARQCDAVLNSPAWWSDSQQSCGVTLIEIATLPMHGATASRR
jgi:hypothetical protein